MDRNNLRANALAAVKNVHWTPASGEERMHNMIATRPDWCISRQRVWGVPITVFYCEACNEPLTDSKILKRVVEQFRQHTADVWYERTAAELLPAKINLNDRGFLRIKLLIRKVGADHEQEIAIHHGVISGRKTEQTRHAYVEGIVIFNELFPAQGMHNRCFQFGCEGD